MPDETTLFPGITITEAAELWRKNPLSVRRAIGTGRYPLLGRKSGDIWLIHIPSLIRRWGDPETTSDLLL